MKVLKTKNDPDANHSKSEELQTKNVRSSKNVAQQQKPRDCVKIVNEKSTGSDQVSDYGFSYVHFS